MAALPAPGTSHGDCKATYDKPYQCYVGQWTVHGPHDETLLSGRVAHCPGKTPDTVLGN
jgi:hypothetical protein